MDGVYPVLAGVTAWLQDRFFLQILVGALLFAFYLPRRKQFWLRLAGTAVAGSVLTWLFLRNFGVFSDSVIQNALFDCAWYLINYTACACAVAVCFDIDIWNLLFVTTAGYIVQNSSMIIYQTVLYYYSPGITPWGRLILFYAVWGFVYTLSAVSAHQTLKNAGHKIEFSKQHIVVFALVMLLVDMVLGEVTVQFVLFEEGLTQKPFLLMATLFGLTVNLLCMVMMMENIKTKRIRSELEQLRKMDQQGRMQYELAKKNHEMLNIRFHDLKHQVDQMGLDREVTDEIKENLQVYQSLYQTGHRALDIILTEKSLLNRKHNIRFLVTADGAVLEGMRSSDIYSLFGNLLDNAAEALQAVDEEKKEVEISVKRVEGFVQIQAENYTEHQPQMVNGLPRTTKNDEEGHGFGVKSIQYIIQKYGGNMRISVEDQIFTVTIILPYPIAPGNA